MDHVHGLVIRVRVERRENHVGLMRWVVKKRDWVRSLRIWGGMRHVVVWSDVGFVEWVGEVSVHDRVEHKDLTLWWKKTWEDSETWARQDVAS